MRPPTARAGQGGGPRIRFSAHGSVLRTACAFHLAPRTFCETLELDTAGAKRRTFCEKARWCTSLRCGCRIKLCIMRTAHDKADGRMVHMIVLPSNGRLAEDADQWRSHARVKRPWRFTWRHERFARH